ncbi:MAG TPA: Gfo/Idh/MocA family oxidoreductase, partial [Chitinophagaceae bacterium]|nr:Gfo/Idh/MocA family oxidoreductase [Chitinophagaceae bacterium]
MTEVSPQILLIGAGSIGRRHLENLTALGYKNISVVTRSPLTNNFSKMPAYKTIRQALNSNSFTTAFICTPTSLHTENLKELLSAQVPNIYIEKPVSNTSDDIKKITKLAAGYKNHIVVGFDLHFDPGLQKVQQLMQQNIIGKTVSVNAFVGQHLAQWRPYEDYRKGMSARVETGGGVLLDIIHEFDYLCWLNGPVDTVAGLHVNTGSLEIETEECAEVLLQFKNGSIGAVHL